MKFKTFSIVFSSLFFLSLIMTTNVTLGDNLNSGSHEANTVRIMTYNIRYAGGDKGDNSWDNRKEKLVTVIRFQDPDVFGVQEALSLQMKELEKLLPEYAHVGVGRDDGKEEGEYSAIFYKKDKFEVEETSNFWLCETPDTPKIGWDAACIRICTWAKLKDKETGKKFFHFNTHFDHMGKVAQKNSAELLVKKISEIAKGYPVVLTGDFNTTPDSEVHNIITAENSPAGLKDSYYISKYGHYGEDVSFNEFGKGIKEGNIIDYIYVNKGFSVLRHGILGVTFNGLYPSDHMPVFGELQFSE